MTLLTSATGYIVSHIVSLIEQGYTVLGFDNFISGSAAAPKKIQSLISTPLFDQLFEKYPVKALIHLEDMCLDTWQRIQYDLSRVSNP